MARDYVKQPNGRYSAWSTITDSFVYIDLTRDQMRKALIDEAKNKAAESADKYLKQADETKNFEEFKNYLLETEPDEYQNIIEALSNTHKAEYTSD